jgi:hypothetical protein
MAIITAGIIPIITGIVGPIITTAGDTIAETRSIRIA